MDISNHVDIEALRGRGYTDLEEVIKSTNRYRTLRISAKQKIIDRIVSASAFSFAVTMFIIMAAGIMNGNAKIDSFLSISKASIVRIQEMIITELGDDDELLYSELSMIAPSEEGEQQI